MAPTHIHIDQEEAERTLLMAANEEDYVGLYSAIWELNTLFPNASLGEKYAIGERALRSLYAKHYIEFHRMFFTESYGTKGYEPIDSDDLDEILSNPVSWYPDYHHIRIVYCATPAGERAYFSHGRGQTS